MTPNHRKTPVIPVVDACHVSSSQAPFAPSQIAPVAVYRRYKKVRQRLEKVSLTLTTKMETLGENILEVRGVLTKIESKADQLKKKVMNELPVCCI